MRGGSSLRISWRARDDTGAGFTRGVFRRVHSSRLERGKVLLSSHRALHALPFVRTRAYKSQLSLARQLSLAHASDSPRRALRTHARASPQAHTHPCPACAASASARSLQHSRLRPEFAQRFSEARWSAPLLCSTSRSARVELLNRP